MAYQSKNLSVLAYANGFTLWHYATDDDVTEVSSLDYFHPAYVLFHVGDIIHTITNTDDVVVYLNIFVTAVKTAKVAFKITGS